MGANAQTSVPAFVSGQVLTAQQQTEINTGIPVFATTTTRDAAFGGAGEKVLAQGQTCYIEATSSYQTYNGSAWVTFGNSGLVLVKEQTIGSAVASVAVTGAFSATYDNYVITVSGGAASVTGNLNLIFGATTANYRYAAQFYYYNTVTPAYQVSNSAAALMYVVESSANELNGLIEVFSPFLTRATVVHWKGVRSITNGETGIGAGALADSSSYTGFTLTCDAGTMTGGTIRIYGRQNS